MLANIIFLIIFILGCICYCLIISHVYSKRLQKEFNEFNKKLNEDFQIELDKLFEENNLPKIERVVRLKETK